MKDGFLVQVWLDGQPKPGDLGDSVSAFSATVASREDMGTLIRMIGNYYGAERGRPVRISRRDLDGPWWCKPSGEIAGDGSVAGFYALETWVNCGDVRV